MINLMAAGRDTVSIRLSWFFDLEEIKEKLPELEVYLCRGVE